MEKSLASNRLSKGDWINHGIGALEKHGPTALKVASIAAGLGVTRGSFYWHFRDAADYRSQILQEWERQRTERVTRELDTEVGLPERLQHLVARTFIGKQRLDRAIRSWAVSNAEVAKIVGAADIQRIDYIADMLVTAGVARQMARARAAFLYWAFLGRTMMVDDRDSTICQAAVEDICGLFER